MTLNFIVTTILILFIGFLTYIVLDNIDEAKKEIINEIHINREMIPIDWSKYSIYNEKGELIYKPH